MLGPFTDTLLAVGERPGGAASRDHPVGDVGVNNVLVGGGGLDEIIGGDGDDYVARRSPAPTPSTAGTAATQRTTPTGSGRCSSTCAAASRRASDRTRSSSVENVNRVRARRRPARRRRAELAARGCGGDDVIDGREGDDLLTGGDGVDFGNGGLGTDGCAVGCGRPARDEVVSPDERATGGAARRAAQDGDDVPAGRAARQPRGPGRAGRVGPRPRRGRRAVGDDGGVGPARPPVRAVP